MQMHRLNNSGYKEYRTEMYERLEYQICCLPIVRILLHTLQNGFNKIYHASGAKIDSKMDQ